MASIDFNHDGAIDAQDAQLLAKDFGFTANQPPVVTNGQVLTHMNLPVAVDLTSQATDPQGDPVYFNVVGAQHGQALLNLDGHTVTFIPDAGYSGPADFQFQADDGYGTSAPATISVNVSSESLINLDFQNRLPRFTLPTDRVILTTGGDNTGVPSSVILEPLPFDLGQSTTLVVVGDFADQQGVVLTPTYLTWHSSNSAVMSVSANGTVNAIADGTTVITVSALGIQAATAGTVGYPSSGFGQALYGDGLITSIQAESLAAHVGSHVLDVSLDNSVDLTPGATGTQYFVSDPTVITVSADGLVAFSATWHLL